MSHAHRLYISAYDGATPRKLTEYLATMAPTGHVCHRDTAHATSCQSRRFWPGKKGDKRGKKGEEMCVGVCGCVCGIWERERSIRLVLKYIVKWNHLTEGRAMMINDGVNGERLQPLAFIIEV